MKPTRTSPATQATQATLAPRSRFLDRLAASFGDGSWVKLTLGHPADPASPLRKLMARPVLIRGQRRCAVVSRFATRDETANLSDGAALALVEARLGSDFLHAALFTETEELHLDLAGKPRLRSLQAARPPASLGHDRAKAYKSDPAARFLHALGVTDARGVPRAGMRDKLRQIERFVDLLDSAFRESGLDAPLVPLVQSGPPAPLTLCDMGAGKGYLTFAAFDYLRRKAGREVVATGVERRPELVALCNRVARECGMEGLRFVASEIGAFPLPALDILIALHACDTATDEALAAGIGAGAAILLAAPCCHKEARPQIDTAAATAADSAPLRDVLRHGLFAERHAEMATDALRALLLERAGYRVRIGEFVAAEHTAKNLMLIATRRPDPAPAAREALEVLDRRIADLKAFYGIRHHRLEELLLGGR